MQICYVENGVECKIASSVKEKNNPTTEQNDACSVRTPICVINTLVFVHFYGDTPRTETIIFSLPFS